MTKKTKRIYHYCSVENFFKIIESKSIWLSNCSQMNDSQEVTWIERYFDFIKSNFLEKHYKSFNKYLFPTYGWNKITPFVFCLSEVKDSLSQWRAYAQDGKGVCIGFNIDKFGIDTGLPSRNVQRDKTIGISKIEYSISVQKRIIKSIINEYKEKHNNKKDELWITASSFMAFELVDYSLIFKNPSFSEEKEWRIIHTPLDNRNEYEDVENKIEISDTMFRPIGNRITSYTMLNLESKFSSDLIPEIVLGPKSELDEKIISKYLKSNKLDKTKIIKSKSTYR
jgi:hypothetical protein